MPTPKKELTGAAKRIFDRVKAGTLSRSDLAAVLGKLAREKTTEKQREASRINGAKNTPRKNNSKKV